MRQSNRRGIFISNNTIFFSVAIVVAIIFFSLLFNSVSAQASSSREVYTYCTSYQVHPGDTLWTIADKYMTTEDSNKEEFINNIKSMNHMLDDEINVGDNLIIEYTSYEVM